MLLNLDLEILKRVPKEISLDEIVLFWIINENLLEYRKELEERTGVTLTDDKIKFIEECIKTNTDYYKELKDVYPTQTPDGRMLHDRAEYCKSHYTSLIRNNDTLHKNILKLLEKELVQRRFNGSLKYMFSMSRWLQEKVWESYDIPEETKPKKLNETML